MTPLCFPDGQPANFLYCTCRNLSHAFLPLFLFSSQSLAKHRQVFFLHRPQVSIRAVFSGYRRVQGVNGRAAFARDNIRRTVGVLGLYKNRGDIRAANFADGFGQFRALGWLSGSRLTTRTIFKSNSWAKYGNASWKVMIFLVWQFFRRRCISCSSALSFQYSGPHWRGIAPREPGPPASGP